MVANVKIKQDTWLVWWIFLKVIKNTSNPVEGVQPFSTVFYSFACIGAFCELGETLAEQFELFSDELQRCRWYRFTIKLQKKFLILSTNAMHPVLIQGFGNIRCTRDTFKNVMNSGQDVHLMSSSFLLFWYGLSLFLSRQSNVDSLISWRFIALADKIEFFMRIVSHPNKHDENLWSQNTFLTAYLESSFHLL